jgi:hypothetical protein
VEDVCDKPVFAIDTELVKVSPWRIGPNSGQHPNPVDHLLLRVPAAVVPADSAVWCR